MQRSKMKMNFIDLLKLAETKEIKDLDDSLTINIHKAIIQKKPFLKKLYLDFYREFKDTLKDLPKGEIVEIGSGAGFLKEVIPEVITSDIFPSQYTDKVFDATKLPFNDNSVSVFFLLDVLHHIDDLFLFFKEAKRCLLRGGKI